MCKRHVVVIGCGNIGSHVVPELPRQAGVGEITLCDPDSYTSENLDMQSIDAADVGRGKAEVQAEKLRRISPGLKVNVIEERVEDVPRGLLICDLILSCLDSRSARQRVNQLATRLGTPWVDAGVLGSQSLVRLNAYVPSQGGSCLECNWGPMDYAALEQEYPCGGGSGVSYPSQAPSVLGAVAGALMAVEVGKIMRGDLAASVASRQVILDVQNYKLLVTTDKRNPWCRWDHLTWHPRPWKCRPDEMRLGDALGEMGSIRVEGHRFVSGLQCPGCGGREETLRLNRPLARCAMCNRRMMPTGIGPVDRLDRELAGEHANLTLAQIGLRIGDIVTGGDWSHRIEPRMLEAAA